MELVDYEYAVSQKCEGKWRLFKWLMLGGYLAFAGAYFATAYLIRFIPVVALLPLFLWIIIYFTYRYVKPDYKYKITEGHLFFLKAFGKKEKEKLRIKLCDAEYILPLESALDQIKDFSPQRTYSALPSHTSTDSYIIMFKNAEGKRCAFIFKATSQGLKALHFYNKKTVITHTEV